MNEERIKALEEENDKLKQELQETKEHLKNILPITKNAQNIMLHPLLI